MSHTRFCTQEMILATVRVGYVLRNAAVAAILVVEAAILVVEAAILVAMANLGAVLSALVWVLTARFSR